MSEKNDGIDIEQQNKECENNEPLEKSKPKAPPGINASLVLLYAIFLFMFSIGWINLNSCSINRLIPIYLIVSGSTGALAKFLIDSSYKFLYILAIVLFIIFFIWQGIGTYFVYKEYQPNYDSELGKYCNRVTYLLAFWILTLQYTVSGFILLVSGCYMLMKGDFKKK